MSKQSIEGFLLSPQQKRLWALQQGDLRTVYRVSAAVSIAGEPDVERLKNAINEVVGRHEILRTNFQCLSGMGAPIQVINGDEPVPIRDVKLNGNITADDLWKELAGGDFDYAQGPLLKAWLTWSDDRGHVLLLSLPALCCDALGMRNLIRQIHSFYRGEHSQAQPDSQIQYPVVAEMFNELLKSEDTRVGRDYWSSRKLESYNQSETHTAGAHERQRAFHSGSEEVRLSEEARRRLYEISASHGLSPSHWIQALWLALLFRLTGDQEISIGSYFDGRNYEGLEQAQGLFARYLPVRCQLDSRASIRDLALGLKQSQEEMADWQEYFTWEQDSGSANYFPINYEYLNLGKRELAPGFKLQRIEWLIEPFDLKLSCEEIDERIELHLRYDASKVEPLSGRLYAERMGKLIEGLCERPEASVVELELLSEYERRLVKGFNQVSAEYVGRRAHQEIERQAEMRPESVAVVSEEVEMSYGELNERANRLAHWLRRKGVGAESLVGLLMDRSCEMVVGMLGTLKAGGAYVPLEPSHPVERLKSIARDAGIRVILTEERSKSELCEEVEETLCVDSGWVEVSEESAENPVSEESGENAAYCLYTSGTSGRPKGVLIPHRAIGNHMEWMNEKFGMSEEDRVLQKTPFGFDASVWEFYAPLMSGGRLILARPGGHRESEYLVETMRREGVTIAQMTPTMMRLLVREEGMRECKSLRKMFSGGEELSEELAREFYEVNERAELHNLYGPTETCIDASEYEVKREEKKGRVAIGRGIRNAEMYVLDERKREAGIGVEGEIYIGGECVGRGYVGDAGMTAEKFVPDGSGGGEGRRLYASGDRGRYRSDGELEYLGRVDRQVKLRGNRIELGEIEEVMRGVEGVREAAVVIRESEGEERLVGYVEIEQGREVSVEEIRRKLRERLPEYMTPGRLMKMEKLPQTASGKIDRRALPQVEWAITTGREMTPPRTAVEKILADIWSDALRLDRVGIHDNFFDLGGDSILSIQIIARANQAGLRLTPRQLFQCQTIAELAAVSGSSEAVEADQGTVAGSVPLTPVQMWFFEQNFSNSNHYNQSVLIEIDHDYGEEGWRRIISFLLAHHDALRLRFESVESAWTQRNAGISEEIPFIYIDLSSLPERRRKSFIEAEASRMQMSLNLTKGPIFRAAVFASGGQKPSKLLMIVHHLAVDGVSWRIMLEDLQRLCQRYGSGAELKLPAKTTSFKQWSEKLRESVAAGAFDQEAGYWLKREFGGAPRLPLDLPGGINNEASVRRVYASLTVEETMTLLQETPRAYHTQIGDLLIAALVESLAEWTGSGKLLFELEGHGREDVFNRIDVSRTVGWFTSIYPVLIDLDGRTETGEKLQQVKEQLREVPGRGFGYGLLRWMSGDPALRQQLSSIPQGGLCFNYHGQFDQAPSQGGWFRSAAESTGKNRCASQRRAYLLEIDASVSEGQLHIIWTYSNNVHYPHTIEQLSQRYVETLRDFIEHCSQREFNEYTPSDFPLAGLDQRSLERAFEEAEF